MKTQKIQNAHLSRNSVLKFVAIKLMISFSLPLLILLTVGAVQGVTLTKTLNIDNLGVTVRYPDTWSVVPKRYANMNELINVPADRQSTVRETARIKIRTQTRTDHNEAVSELQETAAETSSPSTFLAIGGWPGLQRRQIEKRQQPSRGPRHSEEWALKITTAIAAGNMLVRLDGSLPSDASQELIDEAEAIGQSLTFTTIGDPVQVQQDLETLRNSPGRSGFLFPSPLLGGLSFGLAAPLSGEGPQGVSSGQVGAGEVAAGSPGFTQRLFTGNNGEMEIAASPNAQTIVVARQNNWRASNDGGHTFPFSGNINLGDGDPSLAYGQSGNFYLAGISINCLPPDATGPFGYDCTGILRSTDNGQTFPFLSNAVRCPKDDPNAPPNPHLATRCFPDQEHIAADRFNAAAGGDQVYSVWRNFDATDQDPAIVCSQNSGLNWTAPVDVDSGFIPRVGVGQDGFVYVVYRSGSNIRINKYSSCANGLVVQPTFPKTIAGVTDVACPVPGLDRCNDGNNLSSIMVAVDDTNPNHAYVAYADQTAAGNQNILVRDSLDGGVTWPGARVVTINTGVSGVRFMPWVCTTGGDAFVTWYDRRASTPCPVPPCPANNDLTDFYAGSAGLDSLGNLIAGSEFKITDASDPQCASGWPCAPRATGDSESCSVQPQLAGVCCTGFDASGNCLGSGNRCDFSTPTACLAGETCNLGGGCPKYGDYNGNACVAGRLLTAWASATPPPGITPSGGIDVFFAQFLVGNVPQINVPSSVALLDTCVGSTNTATLNVCNTGNANLEVNSISSSNPQFVVTTPSSGFPVVISPDFCFPFQVSFQPTSAGQKTATLTINSNDLVHPSVQVQAAGNSGVPNIVLDPTALSGLYAFPATVVDHNGFLGCYSDKTLVIRNNGTCPLNISAITATAPFKVIAPTQFPVILPPGQETLNVAVRFAPTTGGSPTAPDQTTGTLTVTSNNPAGPATAGLCGEGVVQSGIRVLVVDGSDTPIAGLDRLRLRSKGIHTGAQSPANPFGRININLTNVSPTTATVCNNTIQYHLDNEELPPAQTPGSFPKSSYHITAKEEGDRSVSQSFSLGQCEFRQFILKLQ